jgi:hypothetical protein
MQVSATEGGGKTVLIRRLWRAAAAAVSAGKTGFVPIIGLIAGRKQGFRHGGGDAASGNTSGGAGESAAVAIRYKF